MNVIRSFAPWLVLLVILVAIAAVYWVADDGCDASLEDCTTYRESLDPH